MTDPTAAQAWLDTERPTLVAVCSYTAAHGWPDHTTRLATTLFRYLESGGHFSDALSIHSRALDPARQTGNTHAETYVLTSPGVVHWQQGRYEHAVEYFRRALVLCREIGDHAGAIRTN